MTASTISTPAAPPAVNPARRMMPRSPHEPHRVATPLELFFDLIFVVAVAQAASSLHHGIAEAHAAQAVVGYLMVFMAIWWAWMNFTWFASAYDCDDVPYRLTVFVQMTGPLIIAAGVPVMFEGRRATAVTLGYALMRLAGVTQWLRAAAADPAHRRTAYRSAVGITAVQALWLSLLVLPTLPVLAFVCLVAIELCVPVWAERVAPTPWHPHHIAERYGLLTLIVLGESILAATLAVQSALAGGERLSALLPTIAGGLLIVCSMWWLYFDRSPHDLLTSFRKAFTWGYGHYLVFASAAAVGAGLAVNVDQAGGHTKTTDQVAGAAVAIPVAVFLLCLWTLHHRPDYQRSRILGPLTAVAILCAPLTGQGVLATGLVLAALVGVKIQLQRAARLVS